MRFLFLIFVILFQATLSQAYAADVNVEKELLALKKQLKAQQQLIAKIEARLTDKIDKQESVIKQQQKEIARLKSSPAKATSSDVKVSMNPTPKFESSDGKYSFQPFGRVHIDTAFFDDDINDHPDGATFRSARLGMKGKLDKDLNYKFELDFGNKDSNDSVSFRDVYLEYTGFEYANVKAGSFKPAYGLEELTSANYITFIERSLPTGSFVTSQKIGLQLNNASKNYSWALGVHNDRSTTKSSDDEAKSIAARATVAPINEDGKLLHLGFSQVYRVPDSASDSVSYDAKAENSIQSLESAETGTITSVDSAHLTGVELAGVYGPFSLQGEYFHNVISRESNPDVDLSGWYAQTSYFLTGESRPYSHKKGVFGRVVPNKPFSLKDGGYGAWEVAARYSSLDLSDGLVQGGSVDDITFGVNWYLNKNARLMANYIISNTDSIVPSGSNVSANDDPRVFLIRAAYDF